MAKKSSKNAPIVVILLVAVFLFACFSVKNLNPAPVSNASEDERMAQIELENNVETTFVSQVSELVDTVTGKMKFDYPSFRFVDAGDDVFIVSINFTSKNAFGVDLQYTAKGVYDYYRDDNKIALGLLGVDDQIIYQGKMRETKASENVKLSDAVTNILLNAAANPETVKILGDPVFTKDGAGLYFVTGYFQRLTPGGQLKSDQFKASLCKKYETNSFTPVSLQVGDAILYDYSEMPDSSVSPESPIWNPSGEIYREELRYHHDVATDGPADASGETGDRALDYAAAEQDFLAKFSNPGSDPDSDP